MVATTSAGIGIQRMSFQPQLLGRALVRPAALFALLAPLSALFFTDCNCKGSTPSFGTLDSKGGTLKNSDCGITLTVPAGALTSTTAFAITSAEGGVPDIDGRVRASPVCTVSPPTIFNKDATIVLAYDPSRIPKHVHEQDADLRIAPTPDQQIRLQGISVDTSHHTVSATTPGTGGFFVTVPQGPVPTTVNLTPSDAVALHPTQTQQYSATVLDQTGEPDTEVVLAWTTLDTTIAVVDQTGLVTAVAPGHTQVVATATPSDVNVLQAFTDAGSAEGAADIYVVSDVPSPSGWAWENPLPQGNDIHGLSLYEGHLIVAANNGTVLVQGLDGGFDQLLSVGGLDLAGAVVGAGRLGIAGSLDIVLQGIEHLNGVLVNLDEGNGTSSVPATANAQVVDLSQIGPLAMYGDDAGVLAIGSGNDAYLLGPGDGGWTALETPVSEALIVADADPVQGRRVVGARGQVYRQQDQDWFPIWDQPLGTLFSHAVVFDHDAYACDEGLGLHHFQEGQGWSDDTTPSSIALDHLDTVGKLGSSLALTGVDTSLTSHLWTRGSNALWQEIPGLAGGDEIFAMTSDSDTHGFVGGNHGALYSFDGNSLTALRQGVIEDVTSVSVAHDGSVFAVTAGSCINALCLTQVGHLLTRSQSGQWSVLSNWQSTHALRGVAARSSTDVFVVGDDGVAFHFNGLAMTDISMGLTDTLNAVKVCGTSVWAVGVSGALRAYDGTELAPVQGTSAGNYYALDCSSGTDIYAVGDYQFDHFNGRTWAQVDTQGIYNQPWRSVLIMGPEVFVGGESDYLLHTPDRQTWEAIQSPAGLTFHGAYGMWASQPGDLYLVGSLQRPRQAMLLRYDGALWTQLDPGTDEELLSITGVPIQGNGPKQMWISGRGGVLLKALP
jgi:hypothetical protein